MPALTKRLSARFVETVSEPGLHADGDGLYLNVSPKGAKRWVFIFHLKMPGRTQSRGELSLGRLAVLSLADAREAAGEARKLVAKGIDPIAARKAGAVSADVRVETFGEFAADLVDDLAPGFRNDKHIDQWRMTLSVEKNEAGDWIDCGYCLTLRSKALPDVETEDVLEVLKPIWKAKAETASRLRGRIERVLDAAKAKGKRTGENPARWRGHLDKLLPKRLKLTRGHHAAIPYAELPALFVKLREAQGIGALALEFLILNASRTGEVMGALWSEIDIEAKLWTIPPERMKAGREHRVPLGERAIEILNGLLVGKELGAFVFPGSKRGSSISNATMTKALSAAGGEAFTVHGMRSAFRDWVSEETAFDGAVAEQTLAHIVGDATERAYRRGDALAKRRSLMEAWERYCCAQPAANLVHIRGGKSR